MYQSKEKRILQAVSHYLPNMLLQEISGKKTFDPSNMIPLSGGLLQADASGFTQMSERLSEFGRKGAEELTDVFNRFFSLMLKVIFVNGGDVLKFGGDSLLVFFKGKKGGHRAVATALRMQKKMRNFRSVSTSSGIFPLTMHVGVTSGDFCALSLGDPDRKLELAILGEMVNLTMRCNEAASPGEILLAKNCYGELKSALEVSGPKGEFFKLVDLKRNPKVDIKPFRINAKGKNPEELLRALVPYLPQGVYSKIEADPNESLIESEHRRLTVLFLNSVYPHKLLKNVAAPKKESISLLNDYFQTVQEIVADHGGVITRIDPYSVGDKVLILFGAPIAQEDDEERAVLCALKIREKLGSLGSVSPYSIKQRIGINTGNAFCGEVGSSYRKEYTVMGRDVNLAARLMSKASFGQILVGENTFKSVISRFGASRIKIEAKGISQPVNAYEIEDTIKIGSVQTREAKDQKENIPLIGRENELTRIRGIVTKVLKHQDHILSIVGEPGIGKSHLTRKLVDLCLEKEINGLMVDCHFSGSNTPLLPWVEILKNYCGLVETDDMSKRGLKLTGTLKRIDAERWAPLFNDLFGLSFPENEWTKSLDGKTKRQILFDTIVDLTLSDKKSEPSYLIFEDAHWMDQTSWDLLSYFSRRISGYPILLVLVHRSELNVKELEIKANFHKVLLGELSRENALSLASVHLKIAELPPQIGKLIWEKSRGNPLYLQELIHSLRDSNHLIWNKDNKSYELACDPGRIEIPDTIQDVIMTRIDKLDEAGRKVIKSASVIGRTFSFDTLSSVLSYPLSKDELKYWLNYLDKLDLVPLRSTEPDLQYTFKHALTQEVAYNLLPFAQKSKLHQRIGDYYEKKYKDALEEKCELLAHHYENSCNLNKAFVYLIKAGNKGKRGYSNQESIRFFKRAEEIYQQDLNSRKQQRQIRQASSLMSELVEQRGQVYKLIGEYDQGEKDFLQMLDLSKSARNKTNQIKALNYLAELFWLRSEYSSSQAYVEQAHRISLLRRNDLGLAMSFNNFGDLYRRQGSFEKASECYRSSLEYYKRIGDEDGIARAYNNIGISYWSLGSLTQAAQFLEKALRARKEVGDKVGEAKTSNNLALIYQDRGDLLRSLEMLDSALKIFHRIGDKRNSGYCLGNMGGIYKSQAQFSNALKAFEDSIRIFSDIGDQHALTYSIGNIGDVHLKMGNLKEAKGCYDQALSAARKLGDEELESETLSRFGEYHFLSGDLEESEKCFAQALSLAEEIKSNEFIMKALAGLTELQLELGKYQEASKNSRKLLHLAQQENTREYMIRGHLLSAMAKTSISPDHKAESDLKKALEISTEVGLKELKYRAHLTLGKLYHNLAETEGEKWLIPAKDQLAQAQKTIEEIASHIHEEDLRRTFLNSHLSISHFSQEKSNISIG